MTQRLKLGLGMAGFALSLIIAVVAYNILNSRIVPSQEISGVGAASDSSAPGAPKQKAPDFSMTDKDGKTVRLSGLIANGKPIVLNFWASWCPPCKSEMPEFNKVYTEIGGDVQFMMVDLADGQRETVAKGIKYVNDQGFSFPVYFDTQQEGAYIYEIRYIPSTFFIDTDGNIAAAVQGAIEEEMLRKGVELIWNP